MRKRKTLAVAVLTTALTIGPATIALADEASTVLAQGAEGGAAEESDKTGLWGLLGLVGLAGLAKRKENNDVDAGRRQ